jgi:hypothetical protein
MPILSRLNPGESTVTQQIQLVQTSFKKVVPTAGTAADLFYDRLFEIAPDVRPAKRSRCVLAAASQNEPQTRANESKMLRVACITTVAVTRCIESINHDGTSRR